MSSEPELKDFPIHSSDKIRYADTDRQGHVNNAVFATFLETGRVEIIYDPEIA
ncbi:TPA: acyl-CoA thioesterase, partial [Pseudomonas aeruginosa]|nr:acyl-CoA thioesterase [Pseudomonas aeruginosa]